MSLLLLFPPLNSNDSSMTRPKRTTSECIFLTFPSTIIVSDLTTLRKYWATLLRFLPQHWMLMSPPLQKPSLLLNPGLTETALGPFGPRSGLMCLTRPLLQRLTIPPLTPTGIVVLPNFEGRNFSILRENLPTQLLL